MGKAVIASGFLWGFIMVRSRLVLILGKILAMLPTK